jgi:mRNA interferase MazF
MMMITHVVRRGEVWLVDLGTTVGHEIRKTRPVVVLSTSRRHIILVLPLTSRVQNIGRHQVVIEPPEGGLRKCSVTTEQIRSIDCRRLVTRFGDLAESTMERIDESIKGILNIN